MPDGRPIVDTSPAPTASRRSTTPSAREMTADLRAVVRGQGGVEPGFAGVIPVGDAFQRAVDTGIAKTGGFYDARRLRAGRSRATDQPLVGRLPARQQVRLVSERAGASSAPSPASTRRRSAPTRGRARPRHQQRRRARAAARGQPAARLRRRCRSRRPGRCSAGGPAAHRQTRASARRLAALTVVTRPAGTRPRAAGVRA